MLKYGECEKHSLKQKVSNVTSASVKSAGNVHSTCICFIALIGDIFSLDRNYNSINLNKESLCKRLDAEHYYIYSYYLNAFSFIALYISILHTISLEQLAMKFMLQIITDGKNS